MKSFTKLLCASLLLLTFVAPGCGLKNRPINVPKIVESGDEVENFVAIMKFMAEFMGGEDNWGKKCLPEHLRERLHDDWPGPLKKVPRWANAFCGEGPVWPEEITLERRKPIPPWGTRTWHWEDKNGAWRRYYAFTTEEGLHFREGFRWDDIVWGRPHKEGKMRGQQYTAQSEDRLQIMRVCHDCGKQF